MARLSAWERAAQSRQAAQVKPAGIGSFLAGSAKPAAQPAKKPAVKPPEVLMREKLVQQFQNMRPFGGTIKIQGTAVKVSNGVFHFDGGVYAVSKDGRAVMRDGVIVGEVVRGKVEKPSRALVTELHRNGFGRIV